MIRNNDYEKSVLLVGFIKAVRDSISENESISEAVFTPVIGGYKISFLNGGVSVTLTAEVKGFFAKRLIIKKCVGEKKTLYKICGAEEISRCAEELLT